MKRDWFLQRVPRIATTVLLTIVLLACAAAVNAEQKNPDDKWRFAVTPYLWLPSLTGSLNITGSLPAWVRSRTSANKANFVDPIVGFKGKVGLGKKWHLPYYFDVGGFGIDSDVTLQAYTGLGYRYLYYDFGNAKRVKDLNV